MIIIIIIIIVIVINSYMFGLRCTVYVVEAEQNVSQGKIGVTWRNYAS